ncbi:MAG: hypothetical protein JRE71_15115 [Deltaproteobacteria bacterium]|nr:hypothetical protein [Deltaproteobacteria bacterium]
MRDHDRHIGKDEYGEGGGEEIDKANAIELMKSVALKKRRDDAGESGNNG